MTFITEPHPLSEDRKCDCHITEHNIEMVENLFQMCFYIFITFSKNLGMVAGDYIKITTIFDIIHCIQLMGVDKFSSDWL